MAFHSNNRVRRDWRFIKCGLRVGHSASMAMVELVNRADHQEA